MTVSFTSQEPCPGMTSAILPKQAAIRIIDPRLCGSFRPSRNISESFFSAGIFINSSNGVYWNFSTSAIIPCKRSARLILDRSFSFTFLKGIPRDLITFMISSALKFSWMKICLILLWSAFNRSRTEFLPYKYILIFANNSSGA